MMKKLVYISILSLLLLSSCRSKRMITVSLPQPVMQADSTQLGDNDDYADLKEALEKLQKETADKENGTGTKGNCAARYKNHIENHPRRLGL